MPSNNTQTSSLFDPAPVGMPPSHEADDVLQQTFRHYSHRFIFLGAIIALLVLVVGYMYQNKVASPMNQLAGSVETQMITTPQQSRGLVAQSDRILPETSRTNQVNINPDTTSVAAANYANTQTQPKSVAATYSPSQQSAEFNSNGVQCPQGTNRVIYMGEQALCCQGDICNEANL
ncbi:MAG: hypothetical protein MK052_03775 [Alphaproteobacteria bacterium]|nr:hypothetical protein [Alphaproteobacteria bacterium]